LRCFEAAPLDKKAGVEIIEKQGSGGKALKRDESVPGRERP